MPAATPGPSPGAVVGGLMSDGGEQQTATKEPWSAAAPWLRQQLSKARTSRRTTSKTLEQPPADGLPEHVCRH